MFFFPSASDFAPSSTEKTPAAFVFVCLTVVLIILVSLPALVSPAEDAAILFQYSNNLAHHGAIAYNLTDGPAEGATDFLWMLSIASFSKLGMPEYLSANLLSFMAAAATLLLVPKLIEFQNRWATPVLAAGLLISPSLAAAAAGFSNLVFGLALLLTAIFAVRRGAVAFYAIALLTCLIRPDGCIPVAVACLYRWAILLRDPDTTFYARPSRELVPLFCAAVIGIAYFVWRWHYFGELFPLPFLVKSACADPKFGVCLEFTRGHLRYILFTSAAYVAFLYFAPRQLRPVGTSIFAVMCLSLLVFYSFVRLEQNIADRFFYPVYLGGLMLTALALPAGRWGLRQSVVVLAMLALMPGLRGMPRIWQDTIGDQWAHNGEPIAVGLRSIQPQGKLGTTEAGILSYLSDWPTVDVWGLNTARYARHLPTPDDIAQEKFDLLVVHAGPLGYGSYLHIGEYCSQAARKERSWEAMVENIFIAMCKLTPNEYEILLVPRLIPQKARNRGTEETRFDVAFLNRSYPGFRQVEQLLRTHGSIDLETFRSNRMIAAKAH